MVSSFDDKKASALCTFAYMDGTMSEPVLFQGKCRGEIVEPRGEHVFGWDQIFQPAQHCLTFAEMPKSEKNSMSHRYKALQLLSQYFSSGESSQS